ncbi:hypothetical protein [Gilvibacter sediminis]|uniref:hypothetical protein n=1 Tax=Gilvibacter sediminis TaxID=379071 RepID=UPI002350765A|nr:hypothetical protein [Gilvibacter sediminis]MDC7998793.1 hypothetical protein [Gilvibacter sediminis]
MKQPTNLTTFFRIVAGILIGGHGIYRILLLEKYTAFVSGQFDQLIPAGALSEALIMMFPFFEFFVGALIVSNLVIREALNLGIYITLVIMAFLLIGSPTFHIFYHVGTLAILIWLKSAYRALQWTKSEL